MPGLCFGSQYPCVPVARGMPMLVYDYDLFPDSQVFRIENLSDFVRFLAFDKWVRNTDARQAVFVRNREKCSYRALMIDHGFCLGGNKWDFRDDSRDGLCDRAAVYATVHSLEAFAPFLMCLEQKIDSAVLQSLARNIPPEWYLGDTGSLSRLLEELDRRRGNIEDTLANAQEIPPIVPELDCQTPSAAGRGKGCLFRLSRLAGIHLADLLRGCFAASLTQSQRKEANSWLVGLPDKYPPSTKLLRLKSHMGLPNFKFLESAEGTHPLFRDLRGNQP